MRSERPCAPPDFRPRLGATPDPKAAIGKLISERPPLRRPRIRWRIFWLLNAFAAILYFQQRSLTVAAERIMPELSLSQMQIGWLQWAFVLSYAMMQFPGGVFGQRVGARRALTILSLIAVAATVVVPLAPNFFRDGAICDSGILAVHTWGRARAIFSRHCRSHRILAAGQSLGLRQRRERDVGAGGRGNGAASARHLHARVGLAEGAFLVRRFRRWL